MRLFLETKKRLFYLFDILVTTATISTQKIRKTIVSTLVQCQRRGTLQQVGCCALGQLSQSPSWYSVGVSKVGQTHLIFVDPGIKINGAYYRDVLLKQEMLPAIRAISGDFFIFSRTVHRPIGPVRRSRYCSERFRLSLLPIRGLPTAPTSTLLTTRCGVRCRTVFIGRNARR